MWQSVLKKDFLEIQMNSSLSSILVQLRENSDSQRHVELELTHSEMFELLHTFLTINRTFNQEKMYFEEIPG